MEKNFHLGKDGSIINHIYYDTKKVFTKTTTIKDDKLNFYIPEKWNYDN